ncbi:MAG: diguanylate cyclase domain-containing protein [Alkalilacustris sp.]
MTAPLQQIAPAAPPLGQGTAALAADALAQLMPLHMSVDAAGIIGAIGPTLHKLLPGPEPLGTPFLDHFAVQRPRGVHHVTDLQRLDGARLRLALRAPPHTVFKGLAVPLAAGDGWLINLSFGIGLAEAVREHRLTDADFAPTDLAVELLYLLEAKTAVLDELRRLNLRLQSARLSAEEQALTDTLTGLRNRRGLDRTLAALAVSGLPYGLMQIDLDRFKQVNDSMGHAAGDRVLQAVAEVLRGALRGGDTAARLGGDEFVVLLPGLDCPDRLDAIAARILARIEAPIPVAADAPGRTASISASIGTAIGGPGSDPAALLDAADAALYASKRAGRARITRVPATG